MDKQDIGKLRLIVGKRIKEWRQIRHLTQEELSERVAMSRDYLASIETGKKTPSLDTLVRIGNALGVYAGDFLSRDIEDVIWRNLAETMADLSEPDREFLRRQIFEWITRLKGR